MPHPADAVAHSPHCQQTVVNDLLCYLSCMRETVPQCDLVELVCDFYTDVAIITARDVYYDLLDRLPGDTAPAVRKTRCRNMKDNVTKIIELMHQTPKGDMPPFVAGNLRNVPSRNLGSIDAVALQTQYAEVKRDVQALKGGDTEVRRMLVEHRSLLDQILARSTAWDRTMTDASRQGRPATPAHQEDEGEAAVDSAAVHTQEVAVSLQQISEDTADPDNTPPEDNTLVQSAADGHGERGDDVPGLSAAPTQEGPGEEPTRSRVSDEPSEVAIQSLITDARQATTRGTPVPVQNEGGTDAPATFAAIVAQQPNPSMSTAGSDTSTTNAASGGDQGGGFILPRRRRRGRNSHTTNTPATTGQQRSQGRPERPRGGGRLGPPPTCQVLVRGLTPHFPQEELTAYVREMLGDDSVQVADCWRRKTSAFVITADIRHHKELLSQDNWDDHVIVQRSIPKHARVSGVRRVTGATASANNPA